MCSENTTSLRRKEDLFYSKKEGVVTYQPLELYKYALAQTLLTFFASSKAVDRQDYPPILTRGPQGEKKVLEVSNISVRILFTHP